MQFRSRLLRSKKWEETKRKGCCQCYACDECEGERENYGYHGSPLFPAMRKLPQQGKDIRDCHHSLVLLIGGPLVAEPSGDDHPTGHRRTEK